MIRSMDLRAVAAKADRYFAEQCAHLGPIDGVAAPARKRAVSRAAVAKMDALAVSKTAGRPVFSARRLGGHGGVEDGVGMLDRFRL